jgi:alkylation response protein AidB-like acyl-CoA dehydrogenase
LTSGEGFDRKIWEEVAELGWLAASIPEGYGGLGLGGLATCVLAEEMGRALAPIPYGPTIYLAAEALILFGSEEQKRAYLPAIAAGEKIGCFASVESTGLLFDSPSKVRFSNGKLTGVKAPVVDGLIADFAIVLAKGDDSEPALIIADLAGTDRRAIRSIDPSRGTARLAFLNTPAAALPGAHGYDALARLVDRAAVMMAFEQLGIAAAALDMAVSYAKERYAFGRAIGSFQAIKHKLVGIYVATELARSNCYYGAWSLQADPFETAVAGASARVAASEAAWQATKENIQTHGGMGFTWEADCHLYYRRACFLSLTLGGSTEWKRRLVDALRRREIAAPATTVTAA